MTAPGEEEILELLTNFMLILSLACFELCEQLKLRALFDIEIVQSVGLYSLQAMQDKVAHGPKQV